MAGERPDSARRDGVPDNKELDNEYSTEPKSIVAFPGLQVSLLWYPTKEPKV